MRPGPSRLTGAALALLAAAAVSACGTSTPAPTAGPAAEREPLEQTFGPAYPARAPAGNPRRFDRATISSDRGTLTVEFVGGPGYLASDKCSTDYEPWLAVVGDELDVVIVQVAHPEQATIGPNEGCTAEGYGWTFHLRLAAPFMGTKVKDLDIGGFIDIDPPSATSSPSTAGPTQAAGPLWP